MLVYIATLLTGESMSPRTHRHTHSLHDYIGIYHLKCSWIFVSLLLVRLRNRPPKNKSIQLNCEFHFSFRVCLIGWMCFFLYIWPPGRETWTQTLFSVSFRCPRCPLSPVSFPPLPLHTSVCLFVNQSKNWKTKINAQGDADRKKWI